MKTITLTVLLLIIPLGLGPGLAPSALAQEAQEAQVEAQAAPPADSEDTSMGRTLAEWYEMGGWVMHLLLISSILVVGLVLERLWSLRRNAVIPRKFMRQVMQHWKAREIQQVVQLCATSEVSIGRVLRAGLLRFEEGLSRMEDAVEAAGAHEATILRRNLGVLAALGNIATMIGLLGTVLGMIQSFDLIAQTGTGDARVVAGGIFQALVTTAAGLMVGITAIGMHSYLRRKVEILEIDLEETSFHLLEELSIERGVEEPVAGSQAEHEGGLTPVEA